MMKKTILVITDGIGANPHANSNAFLNAKKPTYDKLFKEVPYGYIHTSGLAVGLPEGQMGNSEVGHMCIGSGRVLYQNLVKISKAIAENTLKDNLALEHLLKVKGDIHIIGLLSDGGVHSHIDHIKALALIAKAQGKKVYYHAIMDGRDVSPTSGIGYLQSFLKICDDTIKIATISGRYYAMDRDNRWDRIQKAYHVIAEGGMLETSNVLDYVKASYDKGITDEFIEPASFDNYAGMKEDDGVIIANFRNDRVREITKAIGMTEFDEFERKHHGITTITMTRYDETFPFEVMFDQSVPKNTLASVIADHHLRQFHTAETEKYAHVTFFLNGGIETPYVGESRLLIPSPKVATYDLQPEMSAGAVGDGVLKAMDEAYDFIVVNFANGDMVGHTGNYDAAVKAVEAVDAQLGRIIRKAEAQDYALVLTSDHGNCEKMLGEEGEVLTNHTTFDVFCFVKADGVTKVKNGGLNNIAPTVLKLMGITIPKEMDEALI
ncbi:2,3-bisphosphoglycerate-independent phosphoglycerate mutase [Sulfurospirillum sp. 1612]|uniref:2,3-bisphosphoglycerate-independent phosphoglycerate mutase n=1 Tax=Sulfurospirillum sp. 1612 TaxID=3094835 RepID=UPI002F934214